MKSARFLRRFVLVAAAAALRAQPGAEPDPVEVLMRVRDQVVTHTRRIPNYTCVETIQRDRYNPAGNRAPKSCDALLAARKQPDFSARLKHETTDRLRLDVALSPEREMYSWAGAEKFYEGDIDLLIPYGAIGSGPFASMLANVFADPDCRFIYQGGSTAGGRAVLEYEYYVPRERSTYHVKAQSEWVITAYTVRLIVDAHAAEIVRLLVRTDELPPATSTCETDTSLEYGSVQLGGGDYLLPKTARQPFPPRCPSRSIWPQASARMKPRPATASRAAWPCRCATRRGNSSRRPARASRGGSCASRRGIPATRMSPSRCARKPSRSTAPCGRCRSSPTGNRARGSGPGPARCGGEEWKSSCRTAAKRATAFSIFPANTP